MNTVFHSADSRGFADHGWLQARHSFSFARWHDPDRMGFGLLRVLNDDTIAGGRGFATHPHDNMEIITIPLEGDLRHKDSMGNEAVIKQGEVQVMSAGSGVFHSEFNPNRDQHTRLLQIWVFPHTRDVEPRYDQVPIADLVERNRISQILSPTPDDAGVWIHQNAWFHLADLDADTTVRYALNRPDNGVYAFVIDGTARIGDQDLSTRDGFGIWDVDGFDLTATGDARILLMEVPMEG